MDWLIHKLAEKLRKTRDDLAERQSYSGPDADEKGTYALEIRAKVYREVMEMLRDNEMAEFRAQLRERYPLIEDAS